MGSVGKVYGVIVSAITLLAILAAWSRISEMKESPKIITNGFNAVSKLFNGAFGL